MVGCALSLPILWWLFVSPLIRLVKCLLPPDRLEPPRNRRPHPKSAPSGKGQSRISHSRSTGNILYNPESAIPSPLIFPLLKGWLEKAKAPRSHLEWTVRFLLLSLSPVRLRRSSILPLPELLVLWPGRPIARAARPRMLPVARCPQKPRLIVR